MARIRLCAASTPTAFDVECNQLGTLGCVRKQMNVDFRRAETCTLMPDLGKIKRRRFLIDPAYTACRDRSIVTATHEHVIRC